MQDALFVLSVNEPILSTIYEGGKIVILLSGLKETKLREMQSVSQGHTVRE